MKFRKKSFYCYIQKKEVIYPFILEVFNSTTQRYDIVGCFITLYEAQCYIDNYFKFYGEAKFRILKNLGVYGGI